MPRVNIKPHGIALNSSQSTIAQGLLHTLQTKSDGMKAVGSAPSSALACSSVSTLKRCSYTTHHFGLLRKEAAEQILSLKCSFQKWAFSLSLFPATSFPGLVPPPEIAEFSRLPTHKSKLMVCR